VRSHRGCMHDSLSVTDRSGFGRFGYRQIPPCETAMRTGDVSGNAEPPSVDAARGATHDNEKAGAKAPAARALQRVQVVYNNAETASRSSRSSCSVACILLRLKSSMSRSWTIV